MVLMINTAESADVTKYVSNNTTTVTDMIHAKVGCRITASIANSWSD